MSSSSSFEKVGECLYRNPSSGTYYARLKIRGKQIKSSLKTKILVEARRKFKSKREELEVIDPEQGKIKLEAHHDQKSGRKHEGWKERHHQAY
jgi:hypothetical protein